MMADSERYMEKRIEVTEDELKMLNNPYFVPVSVADFKHGLLKTLFENQLENVQVEMINYEIPCDSSVNSDECSVAQSNQYYWVAKVISVKGYYARLCFEGIRDDGVSQSNDFWVHLLSAHIRPIGYGSQAGITARKPPACSTAEDISEILYNRSLNQHTLPPNTQRYLKRCLSNLKSDQKRLSSISFQIGTLVEVRDTKRIDVYRIGRITIIIGSRVRVTYTTKRKPKSPKNCSKQQQPETGDNGVVEIHVWSDKDSHTIQPMGWSKTIGHPIIVDDHDDELTNSGLLDTSELPNRNYDYGGLKVGQMLEVIYPLERSRFHIATVERIMSHGYIIVNAQVDFVPIPENSTKFCVHLSSCEIFPLGFADKHNIALVKPFRFQQEKKFKMSEYVKEIKLRAVPSELLVKNMECQRQRDSHSLRHGFAPHMKLEAADWLQPHLMCPATILKVGNGEVLKIRYDGHGYNSGLDQWVGIDSCEIYPVGYCKLVDYNLEKPGPGNVRYSCPRPPVPSPLSDINMKLNNYIPNLMSVECPHVSDFIDKIIPTAWSPKDVETFLKLNKLDSFVEVCRALNGSQFISLRKEDIIKRMMGSCDKAALKSLIQVINHLRIINWVAQTKPGFLCK